MESMDMKYFLYISDTKVEMIYNQIPEGMLKKIVGELNINFGFLSVKVGAGEKKQDPNIFQKVKIISKYFKEKQLVGSVMEPRQYFYGSSILRWGTLQDYAADIVLFGGTAEEIDLVLIGSSTSMIGADGHKEACHSIDYYLMKTIKSIIDQKSGKIRLSSDEYKNSLFACWKAVSDLPQRSNKIEYLAKNLYCSKGANGQKLLVGTPIYVSLEE